MRQGLFTRKGSVSALDTKPSPLSKPGADTSAHVTSNSSSSGPGDQGTSEGDDKPEIVQCPNCGCSFDADDPTDPDSYTPPPDSTGAGPSDQGGTGSPMHQGDSGGSLSSAIAGLMGS